MNSLVMLGEICQKGISIVDILVVTRNIEFFFLILKQLINST